MKKHYSQEDKEKVLQLVENGKSLQEIEIETGIGYNTFYPWINKVYKLDKETGKWEKITRQDCANTFTIYIEFIKTQLLMVENRIIDNLNISRRELQNYRIWGVDEKNLCIFGKSDSKQDSKQSISKACNLLLYPFNAKKSGNTPDLYKDVVTIKKSFFAILAQNNFVLPDYIQNYIFDFDKNDVIFDMILCSFLRFDMHTDSPEKFVNFINRSLFSEYKTSLISVLSTIVNTKLPDYTAKKDGVNKEKSCPLTRTALISLIKHFSDDGTSLHEVIDNFLSEDISARALNTEISQSKNVMLKAFFEHGFEFKGREDGVILVKYDGENSSDLKNIDKDELFNTVKVLFEAYKGMGDDFHNDFNSLKKIELNQTISQFINAVAHKGVFNTTERKKAYNNMVSFLIKTHNHDANFLQPLLCNKVNKIPSIVFDSDETGSASSIITGIIGDYSEDIYNTDINSIPLLTNYILTLDYYHAGKSDKIVHLENLLYNRKLYNCQIINEILSIDKNELGVIWDFLESTFIRIANKGMNIDSSDKRNMVSFVCMFTRSSNTNLFNCCSEKRLRNLAVFYRLILLSFETLAREFPKRKKDIAQGISLLVFYLSENNLMLSKKVFEGIDIKKNVYSDCKSLLSTYEYIINGNITEFITYYKRCCDNPSTVNLYIKSINDFSSMDENEKKANFIKLYNAYNFTTYIFRNNPKALKNYNLNNADGIALWLIQETINSLRNNQYVNDLQNILSINTFFIPKNKKAIVVALDELFNILLSEISSINIPLDIFFNCYKANKQRLAELFIENDYDCKTKINDTLQLLISYCLQNTEVVGATSLLLYNYCYTTSVNKAQIINYCRNILKKGAFHYFNQKQLEFYVDILTEVDNSVFNEWEDIITAIPDLQAGTYAKLVLFGILTDEVTCGVIANKVSKGDANFINVTNALLDCETKSWIRVYLYPFLSTLLAYNNFILLDCDLQTKLIHFAKSKREYFKHFNLLLTEIAENNTFSELNDAVKTALILHFDDFGLDIFEERFNCLTEFVDELINILTEDRYRKTVYGIRSETLIYHICKIYKHNPEKTALICAMSIIKLYKHIIRLKESPCFDNKEKRQLQERIYGLETRISNPCITNIAIFFCEKMRLLLVDIEDKDSLFDKLNKILVKINNGNNPFIPYSWWFNLSSFSKLRDDIISEDILIDIASFDTGEYDTLLHEKQAVEFLQQWRHSNDINAPLYLSEDKAIIATKQDNKYIPLSGRKIVFECIEEGRYDIIPTKVASTIVSLGIVDALNFEKDNVFDNDSSVYSIFEDLYTCITTTTKGHFNKNNNRYTVDNYSYSGKYRNVDVINRYLYFYYKYVNTGKLKLYAVEPYFDYYDYVKWNLSLLMN